MRLNFRRLSQTLAVVTVLGSPTQLRANDTLWSGNDLLMVCEKEPARNDIEGFSNTLQCNAYVSGVIDAFEESFQNRADLPYCIKLVVVRQFREVVRGWLLRHAEQRHLAAPSLIFAALKEGFPCK